MVLKTQGSSSLKDNIINTFGLNTFTCLQPLNLSVSEAITVEGFLSKPRQGTGRNLGDRQFFYVNGRPVDMPKVGKLVNELYKSSNSKQYPIVVLNIIMPTHSYDVNVTPDKRKIFFSDECSLISSLREAIEKIYSPGQCSYTINKIESIEVTSANDSGTADSDDDLLTSARPSTSKGNEQVEAGSCQELLSDDICSETIEVVDRDVHVDKVDSPMKGEIPVMKKAKCSAQDEQDEILTAYQCTQSRSSHASPPGRPVKCDVIENVNSSSGPKFFQSSLTKFVDVKKRKYESSVCSELPVLRNNITPAQEGKTASEANSAYFETLSCDLHYNTSSETNKKKFLENSGSCNVMEKMKVHSSAVCCIGENEVCRI